MFSGQYNFPMNTYGKLPGTTCTLFSNETTFYILNSVFIGHASLHT